MRVLTLAVVVVALTACERREVPPDQKPADAADSAVVLDSAALDSVRTDSVRADSAGPDSSSRIIGHDSAFGPLFAVDSLGRKVELPVRRP
jgi:hypothetical protein